MLSPQPENNSLRLLPSWPVIWIPVPNLSKPKDITCGNRIQSHFRNALFDTDGNLSKTLHIPC
jgi:hypothetical protein